MKLNIEDIEFEFVCKILVQRDYECKVSEFFPQEFYVNSDNKSIHKYGNGPFCKFSIPKGWRNKGGVYILQIGDNVMYVGECIDLENRYNANYGNISPRNCFKGGQITNCKINSLILEQFKNNREVLLYFYETLDRFAIEAELIEKLNPTWNSQKGKKNKQKNNRLEEMKTVKKINITKRKNNNECYIKLGQYLVRENNEDTITLFFDQIEQIVGEALPPSAYNYSAWWNNGGHSHSNYWLDWGWRACNLKIKDKQVTFRKKDK